MEHEKIKGRPITGIWHDELGDGINLHPAPGADRVAYDIKLRDLAVHYFPPAAAPLQVILSCSMTKRPDAGVMAAVARYDGPAWRTYRNRKTCAMMPGFALSAQFGLISEYQDVPAYERELDRAGARRIFGQVAGTLHRAQRQGLLAPRIFVFGSSLYRDLIQQTAPIAGIDADRFVYSQGGIGQQLGQLAAYLAGE